MDYLYAVIFLVLGLPILKWLYDHRLSRFGLSGPGNSLIFEDLFDFKRHKYQLHLLLDEYLKKYGRSFAFYHQGQPVVVTTDEKVIYKVLNKGHKHFENRKVMLFSFRKLLLLSFYYLGCLHRSERIISISELLLPGLE